MGAEGVQESPQAHYEKLLRLKLNELRVGALRKSPSFSFTVTSSFNVYASTKPHDQVQTEHGIQGEDILLEGRTSQSKDGKVQVYFHSDTYPDYLFKNRADFNAFASAVITKLEKKIDPGAKTPWTRK
ncbi:hypothetical protein K2Y00_03970 [Patescibacteria group bacterium]|nr:hypothetical protein [Patescibacteria group bacterium]